MEATASQRIYFDIPAIARITGMPAQTVREWINRGVLNPAIRGHRGRGTSHLFSPQQLMGIIIGLSLADQPRGCNPGYVKVLVEAYTKWDWASIEHVLGLRRDDWTEEVLEKDLMPNGVPLDKTKRPAAEETDIFKRRTMPRFQRFREALVHRLGLKSREGKLEQTKQSKRRV